MLTVVTVALLIFVTPELLWWYLFLLRKIKMENKYNDFSSGGKSLYSGDLSRVIALPSCFLNFWWMWCPVFPTSVSPSGSQTFSGSHKFRNAEGQEFKSSYTQSQCQEWYPVTKVTLSLCAELTTGFCPPFGGKGCSGHLHSSLVLARVYSSYHLPPLGAMTGVDQGPTVS
jgi:hypothetical protein